MTFQATKTVKRISPLKMPKKQQNLKKQKIETITQTQQLAHWEAQQDNFLNVLLLLWETGVTMVILGKLLRQLEQIALKTGKIGLKRQLIGWREGVSQVEEMAVEKGIPLEKMSFVLFRRYLSGIDSFTIFIKDRLSDQTTKLIFTAYEELTSGGASSSLQSTVTTGTSCTTAGTSAVSVDVPEYNTSKRPSVDATDDGLFGPSTLASATSSIVSSICAQVAGKSVTFKSDKLPPGADCIIKLEVYPLKQCAKINREKLWKEASIRLTCAASSSAPAGILAADL